MEKSLLLFLMIIQLPQVNYTQIKGDDIYKDAGPSIVLIKTCDNNGTISHGTGIAINDFGLIVTNHHVVDKKAKIELFHNTIKYKFKNYVYIDSLKDICILSIEPENDEEYYCEECELPFLILYENQTEVGSLAYSIGFGDGSKELLFTAGYIISNYLENGVNYIVFTCPTGKGGSGGALLNADGELIGIFTKVNLENSNFKKYIAVSIDELKEFGVYKNFHKNENILNFKFAFSKPLNGGIGYFVEFGFPPKKHFLGTMSAWIYNSFYLSYYKRNFDDVFGFHLDDADPNGIINVYEGGANYGFLLNPQLSGKFWNRLTLQAYMGSGLTSVVQSDYYSLRDSLTKPEESEVNFTITLGVGLNYYISENIGFGIGFEIKTFFGRNKILSHQWENFFNSKILYNF